MIAIKLSHENFNQIIPTCSARLSAEDLQYMIDEYHTDSYGDSLFFVPDLDDSENGWATFPRVSMEKHFEFDKDLILTEFVEITRKLPR